MRHERSFTPQEAEMLDKRVKQMSESFMWKHGSGNKMASLIRNVISKGIPIAGTCAIIAIIVFWFALGGEFLSSLLVGVEVLFASFVVSAFAIALYSVVKGEKADVEPPVFIFTNDKLYHISADEKFAADVIEDMPAGEMSELRAQTKAFTSMMSSADINAELFYLDAIEKTENGTDTGAYGLIITVIDNIIDITKSDDKASFTIEYETPAGKESKARCSMRDWSGLYEWLIYQMDGEE